MQRIYLLLMAVITAAAVGCGGGKKGEDVPKEKVLLRFKPVKGAVYRVTYASTVEIPSAGQKNSTNLEIVLEVDSVSEKSAWLSSMFTHFDLHNKVLGIASDFDSDKDTSSSDPNVKMFAPIIALINKKAGMVVDDQMKITTEPNFDSLVPEEYRLGMPAEELKKPFEEFFILWPEEEVTVGSSWSRDVTLEDLQMTIKSTYKVAKIDKEFVHLDIAADIDSKTDQGGVSFTVKGNIKGTGKVRRKDGWMLETDTKLKLTVTSPGEENKVINHIKVTTQDK